MIYSVIVSVIFFAAVFLWLVRFAGDAGLKMPDNQTFNFLSARKDFTPLGESVTKQDLVRIFIMAMIFRLAVFLLGWFAFGIFQNSQIPNFIQYCEQWNLWDSPHYIEIAQNGYSHHVEDGQYLFLVFFPLYPLLMRIFHFIIPNYAVAGIVVSSLCYSVGCALTYKLVTMDYSKAIASASVVFLSVFPFSFFYGGIMTESLFFLTVISTFLAIRHHKWFLAGILGMLAALTRSVGALMLVPAAVEWVQEEKPFELIKNKEWKILWQKFYRFLPVLVMVVGTLIYLYCNYHVTGDPFIFLKYQREHWSQTLQYFGKTAHMLWERTLSPSESWSLVVSIFLPEVLLMLIFAAVILYSIRRTRSMYTIFMLVYFAYNAGASWPLSMPRYLGCMFPIFWVMAEFTERHKEWKMPMAVIMAVAFGIYLTGYITVHQIM